MYTFGSGVMFGTSTAANPTPAEFGALQDVSVDISFSNKQLYSQYQVPIMVARGQAKIAGKAKLASLNANLINSLFLNATSAAGQRLVAYKESHTVPSTPYQVPVTNSTTFVADLGVYYGSGPNAGQALQEVASTPATGQYSFSAGTYTFAAGDTGVTVLISYTYTLATGGSTLSWSNPLMGLAPVFSAQFQQQVTQPSNVSKTFTWMFYACTSNKMTFASALENYMIPEFDFDIFANSAGQIGVLSVVDF